MFVAMTRVFGISANCIGLWLVVLGCAVFTSFAQPAAPASDDATRGAAAVVAAEMPATPDSKAPTRSDWVNRLASPAWVERLAEYLPILKYEWMGNELWKYVASLLYIFLAFYVSKLVDYLTRVWLKRWADKTETKFDDLLLELLRGPVRVVCFVILLHVGLSVFQWPGAVEEFLSKGLIIIVAASVTYMLIKFVDLAVGYWRQRAAGDQEKVLDDQLLPIVRKTLKVFVVVVATLVTLDNIGVNITAALASLGIGGLAVALAAQDTLANVFGAVAIFLDKPFRVGDRVQFDQVDGIVETIGLRSTRVRNLDGHLITVPNKTIGNASITNVTRRPNIRTLMNISVTYSTPAAKVQRAVDILNEIYKAHPMTKDVWISFNKFADASLNIFVIHWWGGTVYKDYLDGMQQLNLTIKERFDAERIEFAFPTQTLYIKQDSDWRIQGGSDALRPVT
jgi:MscS family membrane protein